MTGIIERFTIDLIEEFQKRVIKFARPDGRVDPNGKTIKALANSSISSQSTVVASGWSGNSAQWSQEKKLKSLNILFRQKIEKVLRKLEKDGFKQKIFYGWRSVEKQLELYNQGRSKVKFSFHNATKNEQPNSYAADIIDRRYAWSDKPETKKFWEALGKYAKEEGLYWGGDWKSFRDYAHVQLYENSKLATVKKESGQ